MASLIFLFLEYCFPGWMAAPSPLLAREICDLTGKVVKLNAPPFAWGISSNIYKGRLVLDTGKTIIVAIKIIRPVGCDPVNLDSLQRFQRRFLGEAACWSELQHPNIAPFLGICYDIDRSGSPCLISHFYRMGNIKKYLKRNPSADRLQLSAQVLAGLCYLHGQELIHGDIKGANVVVNDRREAMLIDFGLSRALDPTGQTTSSNVKGTLRWMAPELFAVESENESKDGAEEQRTALPLRVTFASDVWASSMTVLEVLTDRIPFDHISFDLSVVLAVYQGDRPRACPDISSDIWAVMQQCWKTLPEERPSAYAFSTLLNVASGLRRKKMRPLTVPEVIDIIEVVDERVDGSPDGPNYWRRSQKFPAPYECCWPWCHVQFHGLVECQNHLVCHALSM